MEWELQWGDKAEWLAATFIEQGKLPPPTTKRPPLAQKLFPVLHGFLALNTTRQMGYGSPQPISFSEIKAYHELIGVDDLEKFITLIKIMDNAYLTYVKKMSKSNDRDSNSRQRRNSKGKAR